MRRVVKIVAAVAAVNAVVWLAGQAIARTRSTSDLAADELELTTLWSGSEYEIRSASLRSLRARVLMGGAFIDLRNVHPSEHGAIIEVGTVLGGVAIIVPRTWDVELVEDTRNAEVDVRLDGVGDHPPDAPKATIRLSTTFGGVVVGHEPLRDIGE